MYEEYNRNEQEEYRLDEQPKKQNNFKKFVKVTTYAAVFGLVAGVSFTGYQNIANSIGTYFEESADGDSTGTQGQITQNENVNVAATNQNVEAVTTSNTTVNGQATDVSEIAANVMPSVVAINSTVVQNISDVFGRVYQQQGEGSGSGIIIGQNNDEILMVTNNHVVNGATKVQVTFNDESTADAQIKGTDSTSDLAVVSVKISDLSQDTLNAIRVATLGNSDEVQVGEMAIAIGNALGYGQSVTVGYISAKDRNISMEDSAMTLLQTDAAINPGNSGGALLNAKGEVIGINSEKFASTEVEGMGYAIPISKALPIIEDLMNRESIPESEKAYLGIRGKEVTEEYSQTFNMPVGIYVGEVTQNSPAEQGGLKVGNIITKFNGETVQSMQDLQEKLSYIKAGTKVTLTVQILDSGVYSEKTLTITLGSKPDTQVQ